MSVITPAMRELVRAWAAWDAKPGGDSEAKAMDRACQACAQELDITATDLRICLATMRQEYLHRTRIIKILYGLDPDVQYDQEHDEQTT